ncbi:hypothetical protein SeMB42_g05967 [Synchytrium endobioticum]|uniref:Major facilitator superfamily (MFS) profile domain-containing protein n=1 Tax=Synchytrium endobioticum TaxID=286115 RepID=A0A507CN17_9FUNG|nr:hypothetical protein SeMB42_g05967 [Synchytrium endobioticum]TPX44462.1 hypothetical protein SeLEV6574_g04480 [Synchytrium endobioticum]
MQIYNYLIAFGAGLGGFLFGYEVGVVDQILLMNSFQDYFLESRDHDHEAEINGNVSSVFLVGAIAGSIMISFLADFLGRKKSILIGCCLFCIGAGVQTASLNLPMLYAGRIVGGSGVGVLSTTVPMFIAESSTAAIRGTLTAIFQLMVTFGILIASTVNTIIMKTPLTDQTEWRVAFAIQAAPGILLLCITLFFLPETPRFLASVGRYADAHVVLAKLRGETLEAVKPELNEIKLGVERDAVMGKARWIELMRGSLRSRMFIIIFLQCFQQLTGINAIMYYVGKLFQDMGFDAESSSTYFVVINAFVNFLSTIPALYLIERLGRRNLLLGGAVGITLSHIMVCICSRLAQSGYPDAKIGSMLFIYTFIFSFAVSWGPTVWVVQAELTPLRVRAKANGVGTTANWVGNALIAKVSPILALKLGAFQYIVYAACGILMFAYVLVFVPETKGVSLENMNELFGQPATAHDEEVYINVTTATKY